MISASGKRNNWSYIFIICALIVLATIGIRTVATPDTWMHLVAGREIAANGIPKTDTLSYTVTDQTWIDSTWLYDLILYHFWQMGGAGLAILINTLLVAGAFMLMFPIAKKWAGEISASITLILCAWIMAPLFRVNASTATLIFPALFIALLSRKMKTTIGVASLIVAQILWTNLNGSFLWGPVIGLAFAAQTYFSKTKKDKSLAATLGFHKMLMLTGGLLIATLINPYFLSLHKAVLAMLTSSALIHVSFWVSPISALFTPDATRNLRILALIIGAGGLITQKDKLPIGVTTLAVITAFLVVRSLQASALFAVLAFPFLCLSMNALGEFLADKISGSKSSPLLTNIGRVATVLLLILSLGYVITNRYYIRTGSPSSFGLGVAKSTCIAPEAATFIEENIPDGKAINTPFDGAYLKWILPEYQIFSDTRPGVYSGEFYQKAATGLNGADSKAFFGTWTPEAVILNTTYWQTGFVSQNLTLNGWALTYFDGLTAIYMPRRAEYVKIIGDREMKMEGLKRLNADLTAYQNSLGHMVKPALPVNLIGAANLFIGNDNFKQAASVYESLKKGAPEMRSAWVNLGRCQLEQGKLDSAISTLESATQLAPNDTFAWLWLGKARAENGDDAGANEAFAKAGKLNAKITEAFRATEEQDSDSSI